MHNISFKISPQIDNKALNKLFEYSWENFKSERNFNYLQKSLFFICCYMGEDELLGFVNIVGDGCLHAFLLDVTLLPQYRNRGIGTQIVKCAIDECKKRGLEWLHVDFENQYEKFYKNCGFSKTNAGLIKLNVL